MLQALFIIVFDVKLPHTGLFLSIFLYQPVISSLTWMKSSSGQEPPISFLLVQCQVQGSPASNAINKKQLCKSGKCCVLQAEIIQYGSKKQILLLKQLESN